jgi:hypothetical protein
MSVSFVVAVGESTSSCVTSKHYTFPRKAALSVLPVLLYRHEETKTCLHGSCCETIARTSSSGHLWLFYSCTKAFSSHSQELTLPCSISRIDLPTSLHLAQPCQPSMRQSGAHPHVVRAVMDLHPERQLLTCCQPSHWRNICDKYLRVCPS